MAGLCMSEFFLGGTGAEIIRQQLPNIVLPARLESAPSNLPDRRGGGLPSLHWHGQDVRRQPRGHALERWPNHSIASLQPCQPFFLTHDRRIAYPSRQCAFN